MIWIVITLLIVGIVVFVSKKNKKSQAVKPSIVSENQQHSVFQQWEAQFDPENSTEKLRSFHSKIVGVTFENEDGRKRQQIISQCKVGERLILIPDPTNKYDEDAVKVCRSNGEQIGHLNSSFAFELKERMEKSKSRVDVTITDITGQDPKGVNILVQTYQIKNRAKSNKEKSVAEKPYDPTVKMHRNSFERSMQAKDLENHGYIDNAIELYETIVDRGFDVPFSYNRLAIIYRKRKEYNKEIVVIEKLIKMHEKSKAQSEYVQPKIEKAKERLQKVKELKEKSINSING